MGARVLVVGDIRDGKEIMREEHPGGDPCTEFLDMTMDVMEEGITGPAAYQHDGENWHPGQVHCHGGTRSYRMGANVAHWVAQFCLPEGGKKQQHGSVQGAFLR